MSDISRTPREEGVAARAAAAVAALERAVDSHPLLHRVPGRSLTLVGAGLVAGAVALSMLPGFSGIGVVWSLVMLLGAAVVAAGELRGSGAAADRIPLPPALAGPAVAPVYAALVFLHAFLLLRVGVVPLLWAAGALVLVWDQYRRAARSEGSLVHRFDVRRSWSGYRRNVTAGAALCLASLFMTWGRSSGYWTGGYQYNYAYRYDPSAGGYGYGYAYDYSPMQYYWPGWETSGRNQSFAMLAVAILVGLVLWTALRNADDAPRGRKLGLVMAGALALFWLLAAKDGAGALVFLVGLATAGFASFRISRGEEGGRWDLEQIGRAARGRFGRQGG